MISSEMEDAAAHSSDGVEQGVAAGTMSNDFASDSILLFIKSKGDEGS